MQVAQWNVYSVVKCTTNFKGSRPVRIGFVQSRLASYTDIWYSFSCQVGSKHGIFLLLEDTEVYLNIAHKG